jgi:hypothetical protein
MIETAAPARNGSLALPAVGPVTHAFCNDVANGLEREAADLALALTEAVFAEVPVYARLAGQEHVRQAVLKHSLDHVHAVVRTIRTWSLPSVEELQFVKERGALRAREKLPLNALLHSYRLGHRSVWERLVRLLGDREGVLDAVLALTTLTLGYTDLISAALAEGYFDQERQLLLERDRDRRDLVDSLLLGQAGLRADRLRLAATFDLSPTAEILVGVLGTSAPTGDSLGRAADTVRRHLATSVVQPLVVVRQHEVIAVVPLGRARATALGRLIRAAHTELSQRGERWAAGISTVCAGPADVPRGYQEARQALERVADQAGVSALLETRVSEYLVERADPTARRMIPASARRLFESPLAADRVLVETLLAYAAADMSVRLTAKRIAVHPNTVTYRLDKIRQLLGRDPTRFSDLVELAVWARLSEGWLNTQSAS